MLLLDKCLPTVPRHDKNGNKQAECRSPLMLGNNLRAFIFPRQTLFVLSVMLLCR